VLDFMGFAQKGGSVLSFVRLARDRAALNQVRIDAQQADAVLACDVVVAASPEALQTVRHGRTRVLANTHEIAVAESLSNPDADLRIDALLDKLAFAAGAERVETMDAQLLAEDFLGDAIVSNIVAMGFAWQRGMVPVGLAALERAIELNGVAVPANKAAFSLGRLAAASPEACRDLLHEPDPAAVHAQTVDEFVASGVALLEAYQDRRYAGRYLSLVEAVRSRESTLGLDPALPLTRAVATQMRKLMAYKDEYEVARLFTDGVFARQLAEQFEGDPRIEFYMAPPALVKPRGEGARAAPKKRRFGPWMWPVLKMLARGKVLRGTAFDPFGRTAERRLERSLVAAYESRIGELLATLSPDRVAVATAIANVPGSIRGYGHVKLASLAIARARESELLNRFDPERYPRPANAAVAGQFRGIPVTSA
jgi:indolepyruvate ferredoxin oxidoreductase